MKKTSITGFVLSLMVAASSALAQTDVPPEVMSHLKDTSAPIDVDAVRMRVAQADVMFCNLARDTTTHWYVRQRAAAALTEVGGEHAFTCLKGLATDAKGEATLRQFAMYALGRRFAVERPAEVLPVLKAALASPSEDDRDRAIRALAYAPPQQALPILRAYAAKETRPALASLARSRVEKLTARPVK